MQNRMPYDKKISTEEQVVIRQKIEKVKSFCIVMKIMGRISSTIFIIWFMFGLFINVRIFFDFTPDNILKIGYFLTIPYGLCIAGVRDNRARLKQIACAEEGAEFYHKMITEGQVFVFSQGIIAVIASILLLPNFR